MKRRLFAVALALAMFASTLTGCSGKNGENNNEDGAEGKTQLYISVYNGGFGSEWLEDAAKMFEEENEDIQVVLLKNKDEYTTLLGQLQANSARADVYFSDTVNLDELVSLDLIADITDVVTTPYEKDADGNDVTIEERIRDEYLSYLQKDGKYYALPYTEGISGVVYDHDLFQEKGWLIYGNGPDGVAGTYDDGLPATMEQFEQLLGKMVNQGVFPFMWTGQYDFYVQFLLNSLWAQYEGVDNFNLNNTYSGTDSTLGEITPENAYKLMGQEGRLEALEFMEKIARNSNYYSPDAPKTSTSHTTAQSIYVLSNQTSTPIAMLIEGIWWENEARGVFNQADGPENYGTRDFRFLPLPKMEGQKDNRSVLYSFTDRTGVFIRKNTEKMEAAKKFVQFTTSEKVLKLFTAKTGGIRPYKYELTDEEFSSMSKFSQNAWTMYNDTEHIAIAHSQPQTPILTMTNEVEWWKTEVNGSTYKAPLTAFINDRSLTAQDYFEGCKKVYDETNWKLICNRVYGN